MAQAREKLAEVLDGAEAGDDIVIERRGVPFVLKLAKAKPTRRSAQRGVLFELVDPALEGGDWQWEWAKGGRLRFRGSPARKPK